ncbi:MAG TPA: lipoyl(octanoyl) transferase LipB [Alphaproteobacteria bacterium]|nr:lipoyl(octanoyl) transferase LipB [Alphaproteobacteria bacterium]
MRIPQPRPNFSSSLAIPNGALSWVVSGSPVSYPLAMDLMDRAVEAVVERGAPGKIWLLEHPPVYTAGRSARPEELLEPRFPVYETGRGGRYTYHGPGQRVVYVITDLKALYGTMDIRRYINDLEHWIVRALTRFGILGERREGRIGIWVSGPDGKEAKIASIGVRVRRGVAYHGFAINIDPDLSHFSGIVPCGLAEHGVTSLSACLGRQVNLADMDRALRFSVPDMFHLIP